MQHLFRNTWLKITGEQGAQNNRAAARRVRAVLSALWRIRWIVTWLALAVEVSELGAELK